MATTRKGMQQRWQKESPVTHGLWSLCLLVSSFGARASLAYFPPAGANYCDIDNDGVMDVVSVQGTAAVTYSPVSVNGTVLAGGGTVAVGGAQISSSFVLCVDVTKDGYPDGKCATIVARGLCYDVRSLVCSGVSG